MLVKNEFSLNLCQNNLLTIKFSNSLRRPVIRKEAEFLLNIYYVHIRHGTLRVTTDLPAEEGFLSDECDSRISPENGGFDVRWVRFPSPTRLLISLIYLYDLNGL